MTFKHAMLTDIGNYRKTNQDYFDFVLNKDGDAFGIVCDGMGGHAHGDIASKMAVNKFIEYFKNQNFKGMEQKQINKWLRQSIKDIYEFMKKYGLENYQALDMGTTLTAILFVHNVGYVVNVGDSRTYKIVNNKMFQITQDQNLWNSTPENERDDFQATNFPNSRVDDGTFWKVLTSSLGPQKTLKIDTYYIEKPVGIYMLTTDGIHDYIDEDITVSTLLNPKTSLKDKAKLIIEDAKENMSTDNLSILIIEAK